VAKKNHLAVLDTVARKMCACEAVVDELAERFAPLVSMLGIGACAMGVAVFRSAVGIQVVLPAQGSHAAVVAQGGAMLIVGGLAAHVCVGMRQNELAAMLLRGLGVASVVLWVLTQLKGGA
jgi:hypothetical protein